MAESAFRIETFTAGDGYRWRYRVYEPPGASPRARLVCLHGIQSHGGWYVETAEALAARGYTVFLTDRRGSGASDEPRGHFESPAQLLRVFDDGAAVFLNGTQIVSMNLTNGAAYDSLATNTQDLLHSTWFTFPVNLALLTNGITWAAGRNDKVTR